MRARRHASRRGFSLLEAMVASSVLITSLTGVALMLVYTSRNARDGARQAQMAMVARQLVHERVSNGLANVGQSVQNQRFFRRGNAKSDEGLELVYDLEVIDTSQAGPLPNLGYNSRLVRCTVRNARFGRRTDAYTHEAYVSE